MPGYDPYKGHASAITVGVQSDQRTSVTPDRHLGKIEEEVDHTDPEVNWFNEYLIGSGREMDGKSEGQRTYEGGSLPVIPVDGFPLAILMGKEEFTENTDSPNTHVLTPGGGRQDGDKPPAMTLQATQFGRGGGPDFVRDFLGVVPQSGEISTDNESRLQTTLETIALGVETENTSYEDVGSPPQIPPWIFSDISSAFSFAGTEFARMEEFTLSVSQNSGAKHYINPDSGRDPYEILYGGYIGYELSATIDVDDETLYDELTDPTVGGTDGLLEFTRPDGAMLSFDLSGLNLTEAGHSTPRGEGSDDDTVQVEASISPEQLVITVEDPNSTGPYLAPSTA